MKYKEDPLRKLARSVKWQTLYARGKDLNLSLFKNKEDLSFIQILFLHWLEVYKFLNDLLCSHEEYMDETIIGDEMLEDAMLLYYRKKNQNRDKKPKKKKRQVDSLSDIPSIIHRR